MGAEYMLHASSKRSTLEHGALCMEMGLKNSSACDADVASQVARLTPSKQAAISSQL
jgi:hypothetical protein